jgi:hypothetical protein
MTVEAEYKGRGGIWTRASAKYERK